MVREISEEEFLDVKDDGVVVIDFNAIWCGPCRMLAPILEEISEELPDVHFYSVNVDREGHLASEFGIRNIPAVVILKNGKEVAFEVGFKPKETMKAIIEKHI